MDSDTKHLKWHIILNFILMQNNGTEVLYIVCEQSADENMWT